MLRIAKALYAWGAVDADERIPRLKEALDKARISAEEVSYINVHGTGTPNNDLSESKAIIRLFTENIPPLSSVKAFIGHTLGASEGIEAVPRGPGGTPIPRRGQ